MSDTEFPWQKLHVSVSGPIKRIDKAVERLYNEFAFEAGRGNFDAQIEYRRNREQAAIDALPIHFPGAKPSAGRNWHNDLAEYEERDGMCALDLIPCPLADLDWIIATAHALGLAPYMRVNPSREAKAAAFERINAARSAC